MYKYQKVYALIAHTPNYTHMPTAYVAEGVIKQINITPTYSGSGHYHLVQITKPKNHITRQYFKFYKGEAISRTKVLSRTKKNFDLLQTRAKKYIES